MSTAPDEPGATVRIPLTQLQRGQRAIGHCADIADLPEGDRCLLPGAILAEPGAIEVPVVRVGPGPAFEERERLVRTLRLEPAP